MRVRAFMIMGMLVALAVVTASSLYGGAAEDGVFVYGIPTGGTSVDPQVAGDISENNWITSQVYETLVRCWNRDGLDTIPILATSWESSEDYKTWTFHLRRGVRFHDGTEFNAEAVRFSFERLLHGNGVDCMYSEYADEDSCKVVDSYTVRFDLLQPCPLFTSVEVVANSDSIISPTYIKSHATPSDPYAFDWMLDHACGTGPFVLVEWQRGQKVVFDRNEDYWGGPSGIAGAPQIPLVERLVFQEIADSTVRQLTLEAGDIDAAFGLAPDQLVSLGQNTQFQVVSFSAPSIAYIVFDVRHAPFDNILVRQALAHAIDCDAIIDGPERGFAERVYSVLENGNLGDCPALYRKYPYDPAKARDLLAQAGYGSGFTTPLYFAVERRAQFEDEAVLIQSYLAAVGINVQLKKVAFPTQLELQSAGDYGMALMSYKNTLFDTEGGVGWRIAIDRDAGGWDGTYWDAPVAYNTKIARETSDSVERARLYLELAVEASEQAIYTPLYQFMPTVAMRAGVTGYYFHPTYGPEFWRVTE